MFEFKIFKKFENLVYGISHKDNGAMFNISSKQNFLNKFAKKEVEFIHAQQLHGNRVAIVKNYRIGKIQNTDALITNKLELYLTITVADCFPIYIYSPKNNSIALVHAGWKGIYKNIINNTIKNFIKQYNIKKEDLFVAIGPGIHKCHFEVKQEILPKFQKFKNVIIKKNKKCFLDLPKILNIQLISSGIKKKNIETLKECTYCLNYKYFSFRHDKDFNQIKKARPMLGFMALKKIL